MSVKYSMFLLFIFTLCFLSFFFHLTYVHIAKAQVCVSVKMKLYLLHDIIEGKLSSKAIQGWKRLRLLHDMMEGRDYGQLKHLISERSRWRQDSK